jgi:hypothetical protein
LSTTITHSKKIGKKRSMAYNNLHLKIKKKLLLRGLSWPIILSLGHGTQNMKSSISSARRLEGDLMNLFH